MRDATRAKWAKRVEELRRSKLSLAEYAARAGVNARSLAWWKWQLESDKVPVVTPLTFVEVTPQRGFEVVLPTGQSVRVPSEFDPTALRRLLDALERK